MLPTSRSDLSAVPMLLGTSVIAASILYPVFAGFSLLPFCLSLLVGLALGVPLIGAASMLNQPASSQPQPFFPSRESTIQFCWDLLLWVAFVSVPLALAPTFWLIPDGDSWLLAIVRLTLLALFLLVSYFWIRYCRPLLNKWFRGRASDTAVDTIENLFMASEPKPFDLLAECWNCLGILTIAVIGFSIVFGIIDFNDQWLQLNMNGPRRFRGLARLLMWCRGNPNSVWSTALLVGIGALGAFVYRVADLFRSWRREHPQRPTWP